MLPSAWLSFEAKTPRQTCRLSSFLSSSETPSYKSSSSKCQRPYWFRSPFFPLYIGLLAPNEQSISNYIQRSICLDLYGIGLKIDATPESNIPSLISTLIKKISFLGHICRKNLSAAYIHISINPFNPEVRLEHTKRSFQRQQDPWALNVSEMTKNFFWDFIDYLSIYWFHR